MPVGMSGQALWLGLCSLLVVRSAGFSILESSLWIDGLVRPNGVKDPKCSPLMLVVTQTADVCVAPFSIEVIGTHWGVVGATTVNQSTSKNSTLVMLSKVAMAAFTVWSRRAGRAQVHLEVTLSCNAGLHLRHWSWMPDGEAFNLITQVPPAHMDEFLDLLDTFDPEVETMTGAYYFRDGHADPWVPGFFEHFEKVVRHQTNSTSRVVDLVPVAPGNGFWNSRYAQQNMRDSFTGVHYDHFDMDEKDLDHFLNDGTDILFLRIDVDAVFKPAVFQALARTRFISFECSQKVPRLEFQGTFPRSIRVIAELFKLEGFEVFLMGYQFASMSGGCWNEAYRTLLPQASCFALRMNDPLREELLRPFLHQVPSCALKSLADSWSAIWNTSPEFPREQEVPALRLDSLVHQCLPSEQHHIPMLKMDIEGSELRALNSGMSLFEEEIVDHALVEFIPRQWYGRNSQISTEFPDLLDEMYSLLARIQAAGYAIYALADSFIPLGPPKYKMTHGHAWLLPRNKLKPFLVMQFIVVQGSNVWIKRLAGDSMHEPESASQSDEPESELSDSIGQFQVVCWDLLVETKANTQLILSLDSHEFIRGEFTSYSPTQDSIEVLLGGAVAQISSREFNHLAAAGVDFLIPGNSTLSASMSVQRPQCWAPTPPSHGEDSTVTDQPEPEQRGSLSDGDTLRRQPRGAADAFKTCFSAPPEYNGPKPATWQTPIPNLVMVDSANERFDWSSDIELQLNHLLIEVLQHRCATDPYALHFVDVGGNVGAKTLLASVLGCNVVTVEPQSSCQRQMQMGLSLLPEMTRRRVRVANAVISDVLGPVSVPWTTKCDGTLNVAESDPLVDMAQRTL